MSSKMTSNGRALYRIAIGLLPSPVSCGNKPMGWVVRFLPARNSASTVSETGAYACTKLQIERIGISPTGAQRTGLSRHCAY